MLFDKYGLGIFIVVVGDELVRGFWEEKDVVDGYEGGSGL